MKTMFIYEELIDFEMDFGIYLFNDQYEMYSSCKNFIAEFFD